MKAFVIFVLSVAAFGQSWSGILSPSRAVDWTHAGLPANLPDGETTANPWTPPVRPACTTGQAGFTVPIASSTSVANLNTAISNCAAANPSGSYLLLGAGTFTINSNIILYGVNNVTLRGSGPQSSILSVTSGNYIAIGDFPSGGSGLFQSNYASGTTSITVGSITGVAPVIGSLEYISQCDTGSGGQPCSTPPTDNNGLFVCGYVSICNTNGNSGSTYADQQQVVMITNAVNNGGGTYTLTISPGLYMPNWTTASGAKITWLSSSQQVVGIGLEDLTVYSPTNAQNFLIQAEEAYASWIKGLRIIGASAALVTNVSGSKNFLVSNNYCAAQITLSSYHACYSLGSSSDVLMLNNISQLSTSIEYLGQNSGVVTAYNFSRDAFTPYAENNGSFDHHPFSSFMLYEGNQAGNMTEDDIFGTHALNTYFRNYISGFDIPYVGGSINPRGLDINDYHRFENAVGNVIGSSQITAYQGTGNGNAFQVATGDSLVASTLLRWGNVTNITQGTDTPTNSGIRFVSSEVPSSLSSPNTAWQNAVPGNTNVPCSFFLSRYVSTACASHPNGQTGLSWWKVCTAWSTFPTSCTATQTQPFPLSGPDVSSGTYVNGHAYDNPAAIAWLNLPVDSTYQNSYTITSSSWTGGIETLTIPSGLPSFNCGGSQPCDLLGAFQLSGANAACTTGATVGPNSELLMTNSGNTTVNYALTSDPGSNACTGTMKFPDVRQFDESVYQNDPPPTGTSRSGPISQSGPVSSN